jgi:hypothetical protein
MSKSLALTSLLVVSLIYTGSVHAQQTRPNAPIKANERPAVQVLPTETTGETKKNIRIQNTTTTDQEMELAVDETTDSDIEDDARGQRPLPLQRSEKAQEKMSIVAQEVQKLLADEDRDGGIGSKVREVARERVQNIAQRQEQAQERLQTQLEKMDQRREFLRSLIGPNFGAMKEVREQITDNEAQIEELLQLSEQETDEVAKAELTDFAQALTAQNEALSEKVQAEDENRGVFGWLFSWMNR